MGTGMDATRRLLTGLAVITGTLVVGTIGYVVAGWAPVDALYMVVITIFSVGYGEVEPITSTGLKVFTIGLILVGCTAIIYMTGGFIQLLTQGELLRALGGRRMRDEIEKLSGHTIVCGFGRVGRIVAEQLQRHGEAFIVLDPDPGRVREAEALRYLVVLANATDDDALVRAGIREAKFLVTTLPDDAQNVFITLSAHALNPDLKIIARGEMPSTEQKLLRAGAARVILPTAAGGMKMAAFITHPTIEEFLESGVTGEHVNEEIEQLGLRIYRVPVESGCDLDGVRLGDIGVSREQPAIVVAVQRAGRGIESGVDAALRLETGDVVVVMGRDGADPRKMLPVERRRVIQYRGGVGER